MRKFMIMLPNGEKHYVEGDLLEITVHSHLAVSRIEEEDKSRSVAVYNTWTYVIEVENVVVFAP